MTAVKRNQDRNRLSLAARLVLPAIVLTSPALRFNWRSVLKMVEEVGNAPTRVGMQNQRPAFRLSHKKARHAPTFS